MHLREVLAVILLWFLTTGCNPAQEGEDSSGVAPTWIEADPEPDEELADDIDWGDGDTDEREFIERGGSDAWTGEDWVSVDGTAIPGPRILSCMVEIRSGDETLGSGFVLKWNERFFVVTELRLIAGHDHVEFVLANDVRLQPLRYFGAIGQNIGLISIDAVDNYLEPATEKQMEEALGEEVRIAGYSAHEGMFKAFTGRVAGVRPGTVQVAAPFVSGNRGSPIMLSSGGLVAAVACRVTSTEVEFTTRMERTDTAGWIGTRLNSSLQWQELDWGRFCRESREIDEGERRLFEWITYFEGDRKPLEERLESDFYYMAQRYRMPSLAGHRPPRERNLQVAAHGLFLRDTKVLEEPTRFESNRYRQIELSKLRQQVAGLMEGAYQ